MATENEMPTGEDILDPNSGYWETYDQENYKDDDAETDDVEEEQQDDSEEESADADTTNDVEDEEETDTEEEVEDEEETDDDTEEEKKEEEQPPEDVIKATDEVALNKEKDRVVRFKENGEPVEATIGDLIDAYQQTSFSRREASKAKQVIYDFEAIKQDYSADPFDFMERSFANVGGEQYVIQAALNYLNEKQKVVNMNDFERQQYVKQRDDVRNARQIQIENQRQQLEKEHAAQEEHKEFFKKALRDGSNEVGLKLTDDTKQLVYQLIAADINQHKEMIQQRGGNPNVDDGYKPDVLRAMRLARRMIEDENPTHPAVIQKKEQQERKQISDMKKKKEPGKKAKPPQKKKPKVPQNTERKPQRQKRMNLQQLAETWGLE